MESEKQKFLFTGDILYVENPVSHNKDTELINEFSKVGGWGIQHTSQLHFYTLTMNSLKKKIKKTLPFTKASKKK